MLVSKDSPKVEIDARHSVLRRSRLRCFLAVVILGWFVIAPKTVFSYPCDGETRMALAELRKFGFEVEERTNKKPRGKKTFTSYIVRPRSYPAPPPIVNDQTLPQIVSCIRNLRKPVSLHLDGSKITNLNGFEKLDNLQELHLRDCRQLTDFDGVRGLAGLELLFSNGGDQVVDSGLLRDLTNLKSLRLHNCSHLTNLNALEKLTALQELVLGGCEELRSVDGLERLTDLRLVQLGECDRLTNIDSIRHLTALRELWITECPQLKHLNALKSLGRLKILRLHGCDGLRDLDGLKGCTELETLYITGCHSDAPNIGVFKHLSNLKTLSLQRWRKLSSADQLGELDGLDVLSLADCGELLNVDGLGNLRKLRSLDLTTCHKLTNLNGLANLTNLQELSIAGCSGLKNIRALHGLRKLKKLNIFRFSISADDMKALRNALPNINVYSRNPRDAIFSK